jgi:hypothetical protein
MIMAKRSLVGPLIGILVAVIVAVAVVIPVAITAIGYDYTVSGNHKAFGVNTSATAYSYLDSAATVANLFPLLVAVLILVGIAGYMTLQG